MTWTFCSHSLAPHCQCVRETWVLTMDYFIFIFVFNIGFSVKWADRRYVRQMQIYYLKMGKNVSSTSQVRFTSHTLCVGKVLEDEWHSFCPLLFCVAQKWNQNHFDSSLITSDTIFFLSFPSFCCCDTYDGMTIEMKLGRCAIKSAFVPFADKRCGWIISCDLIAHRATTLRRAFPLLLTRLLCVCVAVASLFPTSTTE